MPRTIEDILRDTITKSGRTHYDLGKAAGVTIAAIDRFMSGERGLNLGTAAKLCEELGLTLTTRPDRIPKHIKVTRKKS
jgi:plasmid maintenance system antidote protein VapI